jgi:hypothetical protein
MYKRKVKNPASCEVEQFFRLIPRKKHAQKVECVNAVNKPSIQASVEKTPCVFVQIIADPIEQTPNAALRDFR